MLRLIASTAVLAICLCAVALADGPRVTLVKDINPGAPSGFHSTDSFRIVRNGVLYFTARDGNGVELWRTDGTPAGTSLVKDINPGPDESWPAWPILLGNTILFLPARTPREKSCGLRRAT